MLFISISSLYKCTTMLASVLLSERTLPTFSRITPRVSMSTSSPRLWGSIQRSSGGCCVFWLQEAAIPKVHHIFVCRGMSYSSVFSVDTDTFSNNRLSLILHSEHPARHMVSLHVESAAKGASVLYETLKDSETASSDEPGHAPIMYANNKEGITGTFFDWMRQEVRKFLVHVRVIHLMLFFFQDARREVC